LVDIVLLVKVGNEVFVSMVVIWVLLLNVNVCINNNFVNM